VRDHSSASKISLNSVVDRNIPDLVLRAEKIFIPPFANFSAHSALDKACRPPRRCLPAGSVRWACLAGAESERRRLLLPRFPLLASLSSKFQAKRSIFQQAMLSYCAALQNIGVKSIDRSLVFAAVSLVASAFQSAQAVTSTDLSNAADVSIYLKGNPNGSQHPGCRR
jgi:hypothetical protein